jgi:hypothetical protein
VTCARKEGVLREDVPGTGECVLVDRARGRVLALNATGAAVWDLLDGRRGAGDLARILAAAAGPGAADEPPADPAAVEADVRRLLDDLAREGFVVQPSS